MAHMSCPTIPDANAQHTQQAEVNPNGWLENWWSWVHWWEANQLSKVEVPDIAASPEEWRADAVRALLEATEAVDTRLVAEAALALGKVGAGEATARLIELTSHPNPEVRQVAWLGLGLLDDGAARGHMLDPDLPSAFNNEDDLGAWVVAVGLMTDPPDEVLQRLHQVMTTSRSVEAQRLAAWAIRIHNPPGTVELMEQVVRESGDAQLVSEAILAIGQNQDEANEQLLSDIYLDLGQANRIHSLPRLHRLHIRQVGGAYQTHGEYAPPIVGIRHAAAMALAFYDEADDYERSLARRNLLRSFSEVPQEQRDQLRGDPGRYPFYDRRWFHGTLVRQDRGASEVRFGLVSLGQIGGSSDVDLFMDVMAMRYTYEHLRRRERPLDPNRAMAAIGLGLLAERGVALAADDLAHRHDRAVREQRRPLQRLERYLNDRSETTEFRSACALALGLSKHPLANEILREAAGRVRPDEALLTGHIILALGMHRDPVVLQLASNMGLTPVEEVDVDQLHEDVSGSTRVSVLAQRAAIMGVGLLGEEEAGPLLLSAFTRERYISQTVVRSLKWSGHYDITPGLIALLDSDDAHLQQLAAWSLGELLEPARVSRLQRLMQDVNFTLPNYRSFSREGGYESSLRRRAREGLVYRFRAYAAPYMHERLLYGTGVFWH
ncbi:HEAT repeat domain-containing protein [Phycisphaerales bacterium AB-hyl4]|uniref:HEAT repeat domain-containing protein n=1 Tax=Natronomicrosphaera hydrolytica TaxID=3242702 RepID=A0ABV4U9N8_9BACT